MVVTVRPKEWNGGRMPIIRSARLMETCAQTSRQSLRMLSCVSGTALGRLSEPLVKRTAAVGETGAASSALPPSRARSAAASLRRRGTDRGHVLQVDEAVGDGRRGRCRARVELLHQRPRRHHPPRAGQLQAVQHVARADRPVDHDGRLAREERREVGGRRADRGRQHDAEPLARQRGQLAPQHEDGRDQVPVGARAAGLVGHDDAVRPAPRRGEEDLRYGPTLQRRHSAGLRSAIEPAGRHGGQLGRLARDGLPAGRQHHVRHGLQALGVALREPELLLQPGHQLHARQAVQPQVAGQVVVGLDLGYAGLLAQVVEDDPPRRLGHGLDRARANADERLRHLPHAAASPRARPARRCSARRPRCRTPPGRR